jgi:hypothetical protein
LERHKSKPSRQTSPSWHGALSGHYLDDSSINFPHEKSHSFYRQEPRWSCDGNPGNAGLLARAGIDLEKGSIENGPPKVDDIEHIRGIEKDIEIEKAQPSKSSKGSRDPNLVTWPLQMIQITPRTGHSARNGP